MVIYYFVRNATTNYGPIHFPVIVQPHETIADAVDLEGRLRKIVICHDWRAEEISPDTFEKIYLRRYCHVAT